MQSVREDGEDTDMGLEGLSGVPQSTLVTRSITLAGLELALALASSGRPAAVAPPPRNARPLIRLDSSALARSTTPDADNDDMSRVAHRHRDWRWTGIATDTTRLLSRYLTLLNDTAFTTTEDVDRCPGGRRVVVVVAAAAAAATAAADTQAPARPPASTKSIPSTLCTPHATPSPGPRHTHTHSHTLSSSILPCDFYLHKSN